VQVILQGHTNKIRALSWHNEFQHLLFSGSWDGCIRVWDVRGTGSCIRLILDHHADVYGIASHPDRPFFFASSSRDITLRFWRADVLTPDNTMRCIISRDWEKDKIVGKWEDCIVPSTRPMMCGSRSKEVAKEISLAKEDKARSAIIAKFICHPDGLEEVLSLAAAQGSKVPEITNMRVVHGGSLFNVKVGLVFAAQLLAYLAVFVPPSFLTALSARSAHNE
jgi:WD40 repeat protein